MSIRQQNDNEHGQTSLLGLLSFPVLLSFWLLMFDSVSQRRGVAAFLVGSALHRSAREHGRVREEGREQLALRGHVWADRLAHAGLDGA